MMRCVRVDARATRRADGDATPRGDAARGDASAAARRSIVDLARGREGGERAADEWRSDEIGRGRGEDSFGRHVSSIAM